MKYLGSKFQPKTDNILIYPQKDFIKTILKIHLKNYQLIDNDGIKRLGIIGSGVYSNMCNSYKKYYEAITDVAQYQCLNDHINPIYHQPALITRKDMGIPDEEWYKLRDACWMQNEWSASITPKGAFFCEIAAALDTLFEGPGGWDIEPGWWKREPKDFGEQLRWCELCGFALNTFTRDSSEEIDDVSPTIYEKLKTINSPKLKSGRVNVVKIENGQITEASKQENKRFSAIMPYIEHYEDRFSVLNSALFTHKYDLIVVGEHIEYNDSDEQFANKYALSEGEKFGMELNKIMSNSNEWIVIRTSNVLMSDDYCNKMSKYVLNPGTLHYLDLSKSNDMEFVKNASSENTGFVAMFNKRSISLREFGFDRIERVQKFPEIINIWQQDKVIELSSKINEANKDFCSFKKDTKYAIWATGNIGTLVADSIFNSNAKLVFAVDSDCSKQGKDFYGTIIRAPDSLRNNLNNFDYLIIANRYFQEIEQSALKIGVPSDKILLLTDLDFFS
ncbi:MAG: hypothetical protein FWC15_03170 [Fibromonadales bacterium]|nr:hypothetical protein [Fibromonadales bacterium]